MARRWYSKRHFDLVSPKPDTPEDIAARLRLNQAMEAVKRDMAERYPDGVNAGNIAEALDYQQEQIRVRRREFGVGV